MGQTWEAIGEFTSKRKQRKQWVTQKKKHRRGEEKDVRNKDGSEKTFATGTNRMTGREKKKRPSK